MKKYKAPQDIFKNIKSNNKVNICKIIPLLFIICFYQLQNFLGDYNKEIEVTENKTKWLSKIL